MSSVERGVINLAPKEDFVYANWMLVQKSRRMRKQLGMDNGKLVGNLPKKGEPNNGSRFAVLNEIFEEDYSTAIKA